MSDNSDDRLRNPLQVLHNDVFDLIFQHWSCQDILTASTVNFLWHTSIAVSPKCMSKIIFNIPVEHIELMETTNVRRRYRNIFADFLRSKENNVQLLLSPAVFGSYKWRCVQLLNGTFPDASFLGIFEESVENLSLQRITCGDSNNSSSRSMTFPNMKFLKLFTCNGFVVKQFERCKNLKELQISEAVDGCQHAMKSYENILINNEDLEQLTIFASSCSLILTENVIKNVKFKLKKLVIESYNNHSTADFRRRLREFLASQASSLEVVDVNGWNGAEVLRECLKMPRLANLSYNVKPSEIVDWTRASLPTNCSIKRLTLRDIPTHDSFDVCDKIFSALPNLRIYKAEIMQTEDLISLSTRCPLLEELYIENFNVKQLLSETCLPKLNRFKSWDVSDELVKSLKSKVTRSKFEELILSC